MWPLNIYINKYHPPLFTVVEAVKLCERSRKWVDESEKLTGDQ